MKRVFKKIMVAAIIFTMFVQCAERDSYYDNPSWADLPIYELLQEEGRFTNYLKCVDRTLYASSLKGAALYTCFAPNDDAFKEYLAQSNYSSVDAIPDSTVSQIVAYSLAYNSYKLDQLSDILYNGWDTLQSIKKKTPYYETLRKEWNGSDSIWVVDANLSTGNTVGYNNYKFLPYYIADYFNSRATPLTASDYNTFYPSTTYSGKNVQDASIVQSDLVAGNGVVHEVDKVLSPLSNLEKILHSSDYSKFEGLIEKTSGGTPSFYTYVTSSDLISYYQAAFPSKNINAVYYKYYNGLDVPLNCERYGFTTAEAETDGYTVFAPNNEAVNTFFKEKLSDYYSSIDNVPSSILGYFINAQFVKSMVWPGNYAGAMNSQNDFVNGQGTGGNKLGNSGYTDIRPASNGFFYGGNNYVKSHYFETVITEILLNSKYNLLNKAFGLYFSGSLQETLMQCTLNGYSSVDYMVLLLDDDLLKKDGFSYAWSNTSYAFSHSSSLTVASTRLQRLVKSHVFMRLNDSNIDTRLSGFAGDASLGYDGYSYAVNYYGDIVRFKDGKMQMLGNYDEDDWVTVSYNKTFSNGKVYTIDKPLQYSRRNTQSSVISGWEEQSMLTYIQKAASSNPDISLYNEYMTLLLSQTTYPWTLSTSTTYTVLMPNNTALQAAVDAGDLPSLGVINTSLTNLTNLDNVLKAVNFMKYHMLAGAVLLNDGYSRILLPSGATQSYYVGATAYKLLTKSTYLKASKNSDNNLVFSTQNNDENYSANVVKGVDHSNLFGAKAVLHEIDNYLKYTE
jgi:uncharacterized surface protein with fasciclin (FAS1) repeats